MCIHYYIFNTRLLFVRIAHIESRSHVIEVVVDFGEKGSHFPEAVMADMLLSHKFEQAGHTHTHISNPEMYASLATMKTRLDGRDQNYGKIGCCQVCKVACLGMQ